MRDKLVLKVDVEKLQALIRNLYANSPDPKARGLQLYLDIMPLREQPLVNHRPGRQLFKAGFIAVPLTPEQEARRERYTAIVGSAFEVRRNADDNATDETAADYREPVPRKIPPWERDEREYGLNEGNWSWLSSGDDEEDERIASNLDDARVELAASSEDGWPYDD